MCKLFDQYKCEKTGLLYYKDHGLDLFYSDHITFTDGAYEYTVSHYGLTETTKSGRMTIYDFDVKNGEIVNFKLFERGTIDSIGNFTSDSDRNKSQDTNSTTSSGKKDTTGSSSGSYDPYDVKDYDRVGSQMVINEEQADTVRCIFELYLSGCDVRKIQDIMEKEGRKTASGLTRWQAGNINRILQNPFYCGRIEYRKQFVPDYLTQKKVNNHGEVEKIYVEGDHERIISEEDFDEAIRLRESRRVYKKDAKGNLVPSGQSPYSHVYGSKVKCTCGHAMNRRLAHVSKAGEPSFCYQCYAQLRTGTPEHR